MTGRGIDQILPNPVSPRLFEPNMPSARGYVDRAWRQSGQPSEPHGIDYIWGNLPSEIDKFSPDFRLANLETAITTSDEAWPGKRYHFRMHPDHTACLEIMKFDCLSLANNHVMDWGYTGLVQTISLLETRHIGYAGAGLDAAEAAKPAIFNLTNGGRVIVLSHGMASSGIQENWVAGPNRPGVNLLDDFSFGSLSKVADTIAKVKKEGDVVIFSVHWDDNWGFGITHEQREFARRLIEDAEVDIVHGHSCHHVKGMEVHNGKLIIYGCGDFLNDYEVIASQAASRHYLALAYMPVLDGRTGKLQSLTMIPARIRRLQVSVADDNDTEELRTIMDRECRPLGCRVGRLPSGNLALRWR